MEYIHVFEVVSQVFAFIGPQNAEAQANQGPEVYYRVSSTVMLAQFMDLGMAVMTGGDTVVGPGGLDLLIFETAEFQSLFLEPGLQETTAAAAAEVVGFIGGHIDKVFFADNGFDYKTQIFGNGITITFANNLAGILDREFDLAILVPVGIYFEFALTNPLGIILIDAFYNHFVLDVESFQSFQD